MKQIFLVIFISMLYTLNVSASSYSVQSQKNSNGQISLDQTVYRKALETNSSLSTSHKIHIKKSYKNHHLKLSGGLVWSEDTPNYESKTEFSNTRVGYNYSFHNGFNIGLDVTLATNQTVYADESLRTGVSTNLGKSISLGNYFDLAVDGYLRKNYHAYRTDHLGRSNRSYGYGGNVSLIGYINPSIQITPSVDASQYYDYFDESMNTDIGLSLLANFLVGKWRFYTMAGTGASFYSVNDEVVGLNNLSNTENVQLAFGLEVKF